MKLIHFVLTSKVTTVLFFVLLIQLPSFVNGQENNGIIKGRVIDKEGKPSSFVNLELQKLKRIIFSNNDGFFSFTHLPVLHDTLVISSAEFKLFKQPVFASSDSITDLGTIQIHFNIPILQNAEIFSRPFYSYKNDYSFFANKVETPLKEIPQSVSTITKKLIADQMAFNLKDIVNMVPGVNQYSGYDEYTIRGFRAENSRNINGLRGYNTTYTNSMLANIERVEIIKGPAATLYGNGDPGGTINLVTKKPLREKHSELNIFGGSWDHFRALADHTGPLDKNKNWLYRINVGYDNKKSFRENFFSKAYQIAPSLSFIPNGKISFNVDFSISHVHTILDRGQPGLLNHSDLLSTPISLSLNQPGDFLLETDVASIASFSYKVNKRLSFNSGFLNYITQQNVADHNLNSYITNDSVNLSFTRWKYNSVTNSLSNYFSYKFNTGKWNHRLVAGYDYIQSDVHLDQHNFERPDEFGEQSGIVGTFGLKNPHYFKRRVSLYQSSENDPDETEVDKNVYHTQGIYIQDQFRFNRWNFLVGVRQEFYIGKGEEEEKIDQNIFLPRFGITYSLSEKINSYATYNKGFDPFEASGSTQVFNAPVKPQISHLLETGMKGNFFSNKLYATAAVYQLTVKNVAVNANDISNPGLFIQEGEVRSRGIEVETGGEISSNFSGVFSYAYGHAQITRSTNPEQIGKELENAPIHSSFSWIKYSFKIHRIKGFSVFAGHSHASLRNTLVPEIVLPGYIIINAGLQIEYQHFTFALKVENITDKVFWTSAYNNVSKWPGEPRNYMFNLRYRL